MAGKIFINYRRIESLKDAQHLKTLFDKTFGANRVFLDVRGIDGGANWLHALERQVATSAAMVVLIGRDWASLKDENGNRRLDNPNDFVGFEISQALLRHLPIIPVSIDDVAMPNPSELPANLMPLSLYQAMPLRTKTFTQDAQSIAERLKALLAQRQQGVPLWGAGLGLAVALAAGVAAGPMVLNGLGLPFPGVTLPGDAQLRAELAAAQNRLVTVESAAKTAEQRLAEAERAANAAKDAEQTLSQRIAAAEKERDDARKDAATARTALDAAQRDLSGAKQRVDEAQRAAKTAQDSQQTLSQRLAAAEKERDDARKDAAANVKPADLESKNPVPDRSMRDCADCPELVVVRAGNFWMGSPDGGPEEKPLHEVTISRSFAVGKFEVTFAEWEACVAGGGCASNKSPFDQGWGKGRRPVINVSWNDAKEYVTWLARKTGQPYRLLSEAEWEYAARANRTIDTGFGDLVRREREFRRGSTAEVGSFSANAWGLHDMYGNVSEWCEDNWHGDYSDNPPTDGSAWRGGNILSFRALRGGSWDGARNLVAREGIRAESRRANVGFRVARAL